MRLRSNSPSPKSQHKKRREGREGEREGEREGKERGKERGKGEERSNPIYNNESKNHTQRERKPPDAISTN